MGIEWVEYNDGQIKLACGDCLEILPQLEAGSVDAVVTDPPYGIRFDRATWEDDPKQYAGFMRSLVSEWNRLAHTCWVWQALPLASKWHEWFPDGFRIFAACKGFVQYRPTQVQWAWDPVVWWGTPSNPARRDFYARDWYVQTLAPFGAHRQLAEHPTHKPIELTTYVVALASSEVETVLDPFMGSGTTGIACIRTGRRFIGIEIDPTYFAIACRRIEAELARHPLFDPPKPKPEIRTLF